MPKETKDVHLSLRISTALKAELQVIADDTHRTLNNATELVIRKGIAAFRTDNVLVDTRPVQLAGTLEGSTELAGNLTNIKPAKQEEVDDFDVGQAEETPGQKKNREAGGKKKSSKATKKRA